MKVLCIGSVTQDIFFPTGEGILLETPKDVTAQRKIAFELGAKFDIEERFFSLGGCSVNVAAGLAKLGENVDCYCVIGGDMVGQWIKGEISHANVGSGNIMEYPDLKSDLSAIIVDKKSGERTIFSNHDASHYLKIEKEKLSEAEWFFVGDLSGDWKENLNIILQYAGENNKKVALNPRQQMLHEDIVFVAENFSACDVVFVNKDEATEIVSSMTKEQGDNDSINDEKYLLEELQKLGAKIVVLTDGIRGAWGYDSKQILHVDALLRKAVDTTGSGDAFASGFLAAHLKGKHIEEALKWGIINSSNSVTEYGGQAGLLNQEKVEKLLSEVNVEKL